MDQRLKLHTILVDVLGSQNVYFQPTENIRMNYPAIVYSRDRITPIYADNRTYTKTDRYNVIHISSDPDDNTPDKLANLPLSIHSAAYIADNLHHNAFSIYY